MIVILTALPIEHEAVLAHVSDARTRRHGTGTLFEVGTLTGHPDRRVAVGLTGPGLTTAAALTERAIAEFSPSAMLFAGVAGRLHDWLRIGDVVVATRVYSHHGGLSGPDGRLHARPHSWEISHEIDQLAKRIPRRPDWCAEGAPAVHFAPIAAGDVVLNSADSPLARRLKHIYNDAVAIEMEGAGFAKAAHLAGTVPTAVVRGISDHADGTKERTDREGGQRVAARNAAAFAAAIAATLHDPGTDTPEPAREAPAPQLRNTNVAKGNARVRNQTGFVFGDGGGPR